MRRMAVFSTALISGGLRRRCCALWHRGYPGTGAQRGSSPHQRGLFVWIRRASLASVPASLTSIRRASGLAKFRLKRWLRPRVDLWNVGEPHDLRDGDAFVLFVPIGGGEEHGLALGVFDFDQVAPDAGISLGQVSRLPLS